MLPEFQEYPGAPWAILPPGEHFATLNDVRNKFTWNDHRLRLFEGIEIVAAELFQAGCSYLYLDGSYVTGKDNPNDFDACWDTEGVDFRKLPQVILNLKGGTEAQKTQYGGELYPNIREGGSGKLFLDFFKTERHVGCEKGIVKIDLKLEFEKLEERGGK